MNKYLLQSKMKSTGTAYFCWFFLGCHYGYLGKWGVQILYWLTLGGVGVWMLIDFFRMGSIVNKHNTIIAQQIEDIDKKEKDEAHERNMAIAKANQK
jgi:hypothetical protein